MVQGVIRASDFITPLKALGYDFWAGVPCSFLNPLINSAIEDRGLRYISSANEGDAVAAASGAVLGGRKAVVMMQNSGLGNAVSPLSSLNWVFRIPLLLIVTLRGEPGLEDEPQHQLMGQITGEILDSLQIPWDYFPRDAAEVEGALAVAESQMARTGLPYALIMRKGSVAPVEISYEPMVRSPGMARDIPPTPANEPELTRGQALQAVIAATHEDDSVVVATTGYTGRELFAINDRPNQIYIVGSMGCASSFALGLSIAVPDKRVVVVDGDGAGLMRMGNFTTVGVYGGRNIQHLLLDNGVHESTGGQQTVSGAISFAGVAASCGYRSAQCALDARSLETFLAAREGPSFLQLKIRRGVADGLPRPDITPREVRSRLMAHLGIPATWNDN